MVFLDQTKTMDHSQTIRKQVKVQMEEGFHLRPISIISKLASRANCTVTFIHGKQKADAKSSLDLLGLGAPQGAVLTIEATGEGALEIVEKFVSLFATNFKDIEED